MQWLLSTDAPHFFIISEINRKFSSSCIKLPSMVPLLQLLILLPTQCEADLNTESLYHLINFHTLCEVRVII